MKKRLLVSMLLVLLLALLLPTTAFARGLFEDKVVFGGTYVLESGDTLDGNLLVFGGNVTLESDSVVTGDVVVFGGNVSASGTVEGNVVAVGGNLNLAESAVVQGDVASIGGNLDQVTGALVEGKVITEIENPIILSTVRDIRLPAYRMMGFQGVLGVAWFFLKVFLWAILAAVVVLFLPKHTERTAQAVATQPILSGGIGLLSAVILPPVLIILSITICLLPLTLVALALVAIIWAFGLIAIGLELGKRLVALARQDWAPAVSAALGTFILMLILNTVGSLVPCVGWVLPVLVGCIGFGAGILTRLGSQPYPPQMEMVAAPVSAVQAAPMQPPPPPVEQTPPPPPDSSSEQQG
jgi:hypothetical protein